MASSPFVSEEVLHAFVDGETDAQTNAVILAYLSTSPADAARIETWRSQNELIRASFAKIEHEPIPLSLSLAPTRNLRPETQIQLVPAATASDSPAVDEASRPTKTVNLTKLCAAIGIAFVCGMIAALLTPQITRPMAEFFPTPALRNAADLKLPLQALEIAALRTNDPATAKIKDDALPLWQQELIHELAASELSVIGLRTGSGPKDPDLCLFLANKTAQLLTLCRNAAAAKETGTSEKENPGFQITSLPSTEPVSHSLRAVDWREKTARFALAGQLSDAAMLDLSRRIHAEIEAADQISR